MTHKLWRQGMRIVEVPIIFLDRFQGSSKMSSKIVREAFWMVWRLWFQNGLRRSPRKRFFKGTSFSVARRCAQVIQRFPRLKPVELQVDIGAAPCLFELTRNFLSFLRLALRAQTLPQAEERPTAVGKLLQIFAKGLLGFRGVPGFEQCRAERQPGRVIPVGGSM